MSMSDVGVIFISLLLYFIPGRFSKKKRNKIHNRNKSKSLL